MSKHDPGADLQQVFNHAEEILISSSTMHPVMGHAVVEFARFGARLTRNEYDRRRCICGAHDSDPSPADGMLTTRETARRLRVSDKQVYRYVERGLLRSHRIGRHHRFAASDVVRLIESHSGGARLALAARLVDDERRAS